MKETNIQEFLRQNPEAVSVLGKMLFLKVKQTGNQKIGAKKCTGFFEKIAYEPLIFMSKSVVHDSMMSLFPEIKFEEPFSYPDYLADIDYMGYVGAHAFGIQIKPVTARSNFGNYSASERMKANFKSFEEEFGGKVFIVFSLDGEIANREVIKEIELEINRLSF